MLDLSENMCTLAGTTVPGGWKNMHHIRCIISLLGMLLLTSAICEASGNLSQPSTINLRVEASAADLGNILNKSVNKDLYKGQGGLGTSVEILRAGPIVVTAANDFVYISIPVQLTFGYGMFL